MVRAVFALAFYGEIELPAAVFARGELMVDGVMLEVVEAIAPPVARIADAVVVVGGCAEGVEFRALSFAHDGLVAVGE